jgi:hypothetical protein
MRLFDEGETPIPLRLISSETFQTGVLNLRLQVGRVDRRRHLRGRQGPPGPARPVGRRLAGRSPPGAAPAQGPSRSTSSVPIGASSATDPYPVRPTPPGAFQPRLIGRETGRSAFHVSEHLGAPSERRPKRCDACFVLRPFVVSGGGLESAPAIGSTAREW